MSHYHITNRNGLNSKFNPNANDDLLAHDIDLVLSDYTELSQLVRTHRENQAPRLDILENYFLGYNVDILQGERRKDKEKADHRVTHNFAKYIAQFIVGYMTGNPITIKHENEQTQESIQVINKDNDADAINSDLALNLSIYGRAYEIVYRNEDGEDRFMPLDPKNTFVIYNYDIDKKALAGVRYFDDVDAEGVQTSFIEVYTATHMHTYQIKNGELNATEIHEHFYNDVPVIEYVNNKFKQGDFENVLSLIDAYDSAESDTANNMTDFNDSMLAIVGNVDMDGQDAKDFKEANIVHVKPEMNANGAEGRADVKYIYKQYDVNGSEAYKSRLQNDIHKFTNTPDMTDQNFSGTQSGESMKYKLFGLEQVRSTKERLFRKGLMKRYKLLFNNLNIVGTKLHDYKELDIRFTPNLPKSMKDNVDVVNQLSGIVSERTRLGLLDFIEDPDVELERIQEEEADMREKFDEQEYSAIFTKGEEQDDTKDKEV